jgi:predicted AAA+ superfamily ATPase
LGQVLPEAVRFDLLDTSLYLELSRDPHRIEALIGNRPSGSWVVLDEIQKIPALLDEVHRLMEKRRWRFALCGSSARKLRRGGANLLGGRAITLNMEGFSAAELGSGFDLEFSLNWGLLPFVQLERHNAADILEAYVNTYLKEEIREEGLVRNVPPFLRFLNVAGQLNGQTVHGQNIAREAALPRSTVDTYFSILIDTLLGHFLPAWRPGLKVREAAHPKFYWFDPGIARAAAGLIREPADRLWQGTALETMIFHELRVYNEISRKKRPLAYYRTASGVEIDFIIESRKRSANVPAHLVAIEVKRANKWNRSWESGLRDLAIQKGVKVDRLIAVYTGLRAYQFEGLNVLPVSEFLQNLHQGKIF